ncbi:MAG: S41 family peptidase, partial [Bacteroidota bacterium]
KLLSAIPMDGVNQSGKDKLLQYNFPQWYRNMIEVRDQFEIETADGTKHYLQAIKEKELPSYQEIMNKGITFEIRDQLAILRIPSFADSYLEAHQQSFKQEIRKYMEIIEEQKLEKLLLDLRGNTGGTDSHAAYLSSFFFNQSYRYWKYIEVTEAIAKDLKGGKRLFYGKPTFQEGKWLWTDKGLYGKEFSFTKPQKGSKNPFNGSLYILTDGLCMSSCADFSSIMQFNKKALIIGEETGGGYMGNTSGLIPSQELENGLVIDIPLLKYYNFVDPDLPIGRGCIPDVELLPVFKEIKDPEAYLVRVLTYINQME